MAIRKEEIDRLESSTSTALGDSATTDEVARRQAIKQIERRRHFHIEFVVSAIGMGVLVLIWALSEYHNAGGWPTSGFSQSSGIHDVWNYWIVYPIGAWVLIMAGRVWSVYGRKPISETAIKQEMDRQAGRG
jgi:2TM domain